VLLFQRNCVTAFFCLGPISPPMLRNSMTIIVCSSRVPLCFSPSPPHILFVFLRNLLLNLRLLGSFSRCTLTFLYSPRRVPSPVHWLKSSPVSRVGFLFPKLLFFHFQYLFSCFLVRCKNYVLHRLTYRKPNS